MQMENNNVLIKVLGRVKWFNQFKGYGFVSAEGLPEDIFLHFSVMAQAGIKRLNNDDVILCNVAKSGKGFQVTKIIKVVESNKYDVDDGVPQEAYVTMKWFNPSKGFGFAQLDSGEDVFIHANLLRRYQLETIEHGARIKVLMHHTNFGYEAIDLKIEDE